MSKRINISVNKDDIADIQEVKEYCREKRISFSRFVIHASLAKLENEKRIAKELT